MTTVDEFLSHHGIKGQKWGVVKKEETSDREYSEQLKSKYGRDSMKDAEPVSIVDSPKHKGLTPAQKKSIIGGRCSSGNSGKRISSKKRGRIF